MIRRLNKLGVVIGKAPDKLLWWLVSDDEKVFHDDIYLLSKEKKIPTKEEYLEAVRIAQDNNNRFVYILNRIDPEDQEDKTLIYFPPLVHFRGYHIFEFSDYEDLEDCMRVFIFPGSDINNHGL
jgi:hypothetical protein